MSVAVTAEPEETLAGAGVAGATVRGGPEGGCEVELGGGDAWLREALVGSSRCGRSRARPWGEPSELRLPGAGPSLCVL